MGAVEIVVVEIERETLGAVVAGVVGAGVSPLASEGLDEAFGLAIGLGAIGSGEEVPEAEIFAGGGKELGAIGRAAIGEDGLDGDAVSAVKGQRLVERGEDAGDFFVGEERGESEAGMVINGDVKGLDAGAWVAVGTVAGGADAGLEKAAKLFNIKMKQLAWGSAFVADDRRLGRVERGEAVEAMTLEDAGKGSFGDGEDHKDLSVGTALAAEFQDLNFEEGRSFAWLAAWDGGVILQAGREVGGRGAGEPLADGFLGNGEGGGGAAQRTATGGVEVNHFGSHLGSEFGISVHVVHEG